MKLILEKKYFFWFFLNFECVFGILLIFEQKHVLRHKCAVLLCLKYDSFVAKFLILTFQCIPDCDKLLINLIMSYCLKLWCSPKKMVQMFYLKRYFPNVIFLFLKLKGGTGFAKGTILFLNLCAKLSVVKSWGVGRT